MHERYLQRFLVACLSVAASLGPSLSTADEAALAEQLRGGGYHLFLPHAAAEQTYPTDYRDPPECAPRTRLTPTGWGTAKAVGVGLLKRGVLVEVVHASPVCAARHTAYLVIGADRVRIDPQLAIDCGNRDAATKSAAELRALLQAPLPYSDVNVAVVAHPCSLAAIADPQWPACARQPEPGSVVVLSTAGAAIRWVGCLSATTLTAWSREREF